MQISANHSKNAYRASGIVIFLPTPGFLVFWLGWFNIYFTASFIIYHLFIISFTKLNGWLEIEITVLSFFQVWIDLSNSTYNMCFTWCFFLYVSSFCRRSLTFWNFLLLHTLVVSFCTTFLENPFLLRYIYLSQRKWIYDQTWRIDHLKYNFRSQFTTKPLQMKLYFINKTSIRMIFVFSFYKQWQKQ